MKYESIKIRHLWNIPIIRSICDVIGMLRCFVSSTESFIYRHTWNIGACLMLVFSLQLPQARAQINTLECVKFNVFGSHICSILLMCCVKCYGSGSDKISFSFRRSCKMEFSIDALECELYIFYTKDSIKWKDMMDSLSWVFLD